MAHKHIDEGLLTALTRSHEMVLRVDVIAGDELRAGNIPILGGTINATMLADVSRTGDIQVSRSLIDAGLLDPNKDKVQISTGPAGWPLIPIFTGRVQTYTLNDSGVVSVPLADMGKDIIDATFERPWAPRAGNEVTFEMTRIIQDVDPNMGVDVEHAHFGRVPSGLAWEEDRGRALDELAAAINCIWQATPGGDFIVYPNPYYSPLALVRSMEPILTLRDGPGGTITSYAETHSRELVKNSITVVVERTDNTLPVRVTVRDSNPGSPTQWGGAFGKANRVVKIQTPLNRGKALALAHRILSQSLALGYSITLTTPHFPLLDPGDVIGIEVGGTGTVQVVESITYPLMAIDRTTLSTRELRQTSAGESEV